jgi:hypothetical protein
MVAYSTSFLKVRWTSLSLARTVLRLGAMNPKMRAMAYSAGLRTVPQNVPDGNDAVNRERVLVPFEAAGFIDPRKSQDCLPMQKRARCPWSP